MNAYEKISLHVKITLLSDNVTYIDKYCLILNSLFKMGFNMNMEIVIDKEYRNLFQNKLRERCICLIMDFIF